MSTNKYLVKGINDEDWEEIFICIRFAAKFADQDIKNDDLRILNNIQVREVE